MPFYRRRPHDRELFLRPQAPSPAPARSAAGDALADAAGSATGRTEGAVAGSATSFPAAAPGYRGYAVIDVETTGLSPHSAHMIEFAVVLLDPHFREQSSWSTLLNPGPGVAMGATWIHGLRRGDVDSAPGVVDVADAVARDLAGRVIVAHNARFDIGFVRAAFSEGEARAQRLRPGAYVPRVCTMQWAREFMETPSRSLRACCESAGVLLENHHSALADAYACAELLQFYARTQERAGDARLPWHGECERASSAPLWHWDEDAAQAQQRLLLPRS